MKNTNSITLEGRHRKLDVPELSPDVEDHSNCLCMGSFATMKDVSVHGGVRVTMASIPFIGEDDDEGVSIVRTRNDSNSHPVDFCAGYNRQSRWT